MRKFFLFLIDIYRKYISGLKMSPTCRFTPTCSSYAYHSINEWGIIIGLILSTFRLLRCNPLCKPGKDPVLRRKRKYIPKLMNYNCMSQNKKYEKERRNFYFVSDYKIPSLFGKI